MEFSHEPVLFDECMEQLAIRPEGVYVDGTLGGGGHSAGILARLGDKGRLIGIDRDRRRDCRSQRAAGAAMRALWRCGGNFHDAAELLAGVGVQRISGMLLDLGVSSYQLGRGRAGIFVSCRRAVGHAHGSFAIADGARRG